MAVMHRNGVRTLWSLAAAGALAAAALAPSVASAGTAGNPSDRLLPRPLRGDAAVRQVGERAILAANQRLGSDRVRRMLADPTTWVDIEGRLYVQEPDESPAPVEAAAAADEPVWQAPYPLASTFLLESRPGALRTMYLDFDGGVVSGTLWNDNYNGGNPITVGAFDRDGKAGFSDQELRMIQEIWLRVAEDYATFDINVTTKYPGDAAIDRTDGNDQQYGNVVQFSQSDPIRSACGCAGIAYVGVFDRTYSHMRTQPAWVFTSSGIGSAAKYIAEAASHEAGHNLGLSHDGKGTANYYGGQGIWAPIMGTGYTGSLSQWSNGDYTSATNHEDDYAVMAAYGGSPLPDDHGNTAATATALGSSTVDLRGVIGPNADIDVFGVSLVAGAATFTVVPAPIGGNLDLSLELRDGLGNVVASANPTALDSPSSYDADGTAASVTYSVPSAGTYTLWVRGVGQGNPLVDGYSTYGVTGRYHLLSGRPTLSVARTGTGFGTVTSNVGGINCGSTCATQVDPHTSVQLTAAPAYNSVLSGWTGGPCDGSTSTTCTVQVRDVMTVGVQFTTVGPAQAALTVQKPGTGQGTVSGAGIDCGATCVAEVELGQALTLTASPSPGSTFAGWSGACTGTGACVVTPTGAVTVTAMFETTSDTLRVLATPIRLVDTRPGQRGVLEATTDEATAFTAGQVRRYVPGSVVPIPSGATLALNLVAVSPSTTGYLQVYPCAATSDPVPPASFLNYTAAVNIANNGLVTLPASGGFCVKSSQVAHVIVDTTGWFPNAETFEPLPAPVRLFDTRPGQLGVLEATDSTTPFGAGTVRRYVPVGSGGVPASGVSAVVVNMVAVTPTSAGILQAYPCTSPSDPPPATATVTFRSGVNIAGGALVALDPTGGFCVRSTGTAHVLVDTTGWIRPAQGFATFDLPSLPVRLVDTRAVYKGSLEGIDDAAPLSPMVVRRYVLAGQGGLPAADQLGSVSLTVTALDPTILGYLTIWPCDSTATPPPATSTLNYASGAVGNGALVATSSNGGVCLLSSRTTNVTIDVTNWFER